MSESTTTQTPGQQCAHWLKAAKIKAKEKGTVVTWEEVAKVIDVTLAGITYFGNPPAIPKAKQSDSKVVSSDKSKIVAIYEAYPRKVGRRAALKAIELAIKEVAKGLLSARMAACVDPEAYLLAKTKAFAEAFSKWPVQEQHFCPHPSTWFNQGRYDDDPQQWIRSNPSELASIKDYSKL